MSAHALWTVPSCYAVVLFVAAFMLTSKHFSFAGMNILLYGTGVFLLLFVIQDGFL